MQNQSFMIFSPTGEKPKITLASIVSEKGKACCIIDGYTDDILTCLSAIVSSLYHHANIPMERITLAVAEGMVKDLKCTEVDDNDHE